MTPAIAIDLDGALGDTRPLWDAFLLDAARRFRAIAPLEPGSLAADRIRAARELDEWAAHGVGDWRAALARFAEDHAPVYLRPRPAANSTLRALAASGSRILAFTDAPLELAHVALAHLGVARYVEELVCASAEDALELMRERIGSGAQIMRTPDDLARIIET